MCLSECKDSEKYGYEQEKMTKKCTFWCFEVFIGYSWNIYGIFMEYSYVSVMCRLCIGYASVMYRNYLLPRRFERDKKAPTLIHSIRLL